jgi:acetolactate synthase-1/2/3 large subunit
VHVHPDPSELGAVYEPELGINSGLPEVASALRSLDPLESRWADWTDAARADYLANLRHRELPGELDLGEVMATLRERLPADTIVTSGAGNFTVWAHRFYEFSVYPSQLAPRSGAMAYGVPAAVAAKAVFPERTVVCIAGDGDFQMSGQELGTAIQYDLPIVVLVVNNGMFGTIRMHQERLYPGRVVGTDLVNPDFAAFAAAFGAHGETVERTEDFPDALERALRAGRAAVVELRVDPEAISPRHTISEIREAVRR